jgi:hypothetical protein
VFILKFRTRPGIDGIKALRFLLKRARKLGLIAIDATEQQEGDPQPRNNQQTEKSNNRINEEILK